MSLACRLIGHRRPYKAVWNNGYYFGRCGRCGTDLIRSAGSERWKTVPRGYVVNWKPMREFDVRW